RHAGESTHLPLTVANVSEAGLPTGVRIAPCTDEDIVVLLDVDSRAWRIPPTFDQVLHGKYHEYIAVRTATCVVAAQLHGGQSKTVKLERADDAGANDVLFIDSSDNEEEGAKKSAPRPAARKAPRGKAKK
ncbi:MAG: hypothetical protein ACO32I_08180, partial [Candidatus Limnocylindrus sp.]